MNKKKIFGAFAVLAIAAMAAFNTNINADENGLSDISLNNVEALAGEKHGGQRVCYDTVTTKAGDETFYCGICDWLDSSIPSTFSSKEECW
jgi:hypothetical protein